MAIYYRDVCRGFIKPMLAQKQALFIKQLNLVNITERLRSTVKEEEYKGKNGKNKD
jgi:hypothetical protein